MRIHFGHKIIMVFLVFGALMTFLVYSSIKTNFDLVTKEYYKDELAYQSVIEAKSNSRKLQTGIDVDYNDKLVSLSLPDEMSGKRISGSVWFYCPSDASKDVKEVLSSNTTINYLFDSNKLKPGKYIVKVQWDADGTSYNSEADLIVP